MRHKQCSTEVGVDGLDMKDIYEKRHFLFVNKNKMLNGSFPACILYLMPDWEA